jgi:CubicO group peptidase (beta-lactamase class C family)
MFPYTQLVLSPGERYSYSNPAYIYLAKVIERVTGDPWEEYIHKNIFQPLGMSHSYFRGTPWHLASDRSNGYSVRRDSAAGRPVVRANGRDFDPGVTVPNSGWNAPIGDLVKYAAFLTGSAPNDGVLMRASFAEMWTAVAPTGTGSYDSDSRNSMGLGFFLFERGGRTLVGHTGDQGGYRSLLYLDPERRVAAIGVWNTDNPADGRASGERLKRAQEAVLEGVARLESRGAR